jgi:hypothetical protein
MRRAPARLAGRLPLLAVLVLFPAARGADDVVNEFRPSVGFGYAEVSSEADGEVVRVPVAYATRDPFLGLVIGPVAEQLRAQLGIPEGFGLAVEAVAEDGPAERGGVKKFDILRKFDDQFLCTPEQLSALVKAAGSGKEVALTVIRGGKEQVVKVSIGDQEVAAGRPASAATAVGGDATIDNGTPGALSVSLSGIDAAARVQVQRHLQESLAQAARGLYRPHVVQVYPGGAGQHVIVHSDERGKVEIRETNGKRTVTIKDRAGKEMHAGPLDTDADRKKVPAAFRGMVEEVEKQLGGVQSAVRP